MSPRRTGGPRRRPGLRLALLGLAPLAALGSAAPPGPSAPPPHVRGDELLAAAPAQLIRTLHRERVALFDDAGGGGSWVRGYVLFEAPRPEVMRLLSQSARQQEYRPELRRLRTIRRTEGESIDEHRMVILFVKITYRLRQRVDFEAHRIAWDLDPEFDTPIRAIEGSWELYEMADGGTLGSFATRVDVGPALPAFLQEYATRKSVPRTLERTRRWVDSHAAWRP